MRASFDSFDQHRFASVDRFHLVASIDSLFAGDEWFTFFYYDNDEITAWAPLEDDFILLFVDGVPKARQNRTEFSGEIHLPPWKLTNGTHAIALTLWHKRAIVAFSTHFLEFKNGVAVAPRCVNLSLALVAATLPWPPDPLNTCCGDEVWTPFCRYQPQTHIVFILSPPFRSRSCDKTTAIEGIFND